MKVTRYEEVPAVTIALDAAGKIVGQVVFTYTKGIAALNPSYTLLTKDGRYVTVPRSSVRLEELR